MTDEPAATDSPKASNPEGNSRLAAARVVGEWLETGRFPSRMMAPVAGSRAFVNEVVQGCVRWKGMLDWVIDRYAARPPAPPIRALLMVGLYQLLRMDSVPVFAAVNETVDAARRGGQGRFTGFLNGVLRRADREREALLAELARQDLAVRESHPETLVRRWISRYSEADTEALCRWDNQPPFVVVRVNILRTTPEAYAAQLQAAGIEARPVPAPAVACLTLAHGARVDQLPGFAEGLFTVCDPSTLRAVELTGAQPGERVLDACAAPGGKTIMLAQRMGDRGVIVAMDVSAARLERVHENVARLGLQSVRTVAGSAADQQAVAKVTADGLFDRVLLDAPCTNTGTLRRRPDARWRFTSEHLETAVRRQRALLDTVSAAVKPGGILVYSTCSIEPEENEAQVGTWLREHPGFTEVAREALFPPRSGTDGAFCAALRRKA
jgi:16S rRNA (cytosine967-C5)-methyltransferase